MKPTDRVAAVADERAKKILTPRWRTEDEAAFLRALTALNLRRCLLAGIIGGMIALWSSFALRYLVELSMDGLRDWATICIGIYALMLLPWRWVARPGTPERVRRVYVMLFAIALIGICDGFFFAFARQSSLVSSFSRGMLVVAVLFVLPPRWFVPLIVVNEALLCAWLAWRGVNELTMAAFLDGTVGAIVSVVVSVMLYRAKRVDFFQQREIERQHAERADLMAIAAHDLRSPLIGLKNLLSLALARTELTRERLAEVVADGARACDRMLGLVGRLLDAHAAETRESEAMRTIDLRAVVEQTVARARATAEAKGVLLESQLPAMAVDARVDAEGLAQVLDNLVANALKFSPRGAPAEIVLEATETRWRIDVIDRGPGVAPHEQAQLFRKYARGSTPATEGEAGSGLGLYIARTLAERTGASVSFAVREEGGSVFSVEGVRAS